MPEQDTRSRIKDLVEILRKSYREHAEIIKVDAANRLNRSVIIDVLEKLRALIFPGYFGKKLIGCDPADYYAGELIEEVVYELAPQIEKAVSTDAEGAKDIVFRFLAALPALRECLATDVSAAFEGDPAAQSRDEIITSYPGIHAITVYRLAHELFLLKVPMIPRIMTEYAHGVTGIDIHPGALIGRHFFIDHGTGIVIGETTRIGNHVKIYQGVTLGGLSTSGGRDLSGKKRHPTIEDNVTIYSGASIFGGETVIGAGAVIRSSAFITESVPAKARI